MKKTAIAFAAVLALGAVGILRAEAGAAGPHDPSSTRPGAKAPKQGHRQPGESAGSAKEHKVHAQSVGDLRAARKAVAKDEPAPAAGAAADPKATREALRKARSIKD